MLLMSELEDPPTVEVESYLMSLTVLNLPSDDDQPDDGKTGALMGPSHDGPSGDLVGEKVALVTFLLCCLSSLVPAVPLCYILPSMFRSLRIQKRVTSSVSSNFVN
jgi:hypothetical protein